MLLHGGSLGGVIVVKLLTVHQNTTNVSSHQWDHITNSMNHMFQPSTTNNRDVFFICSSSGLGLRLVDRCHHVSTVRKNASETCVGSGLQVESFYRSGTKKTISPTSPLCLQHLVILGQHSLHHLKYIETSSFCMRSLAKGELTILSLRLMSSSSSFFL